MEALHVRGERQITFLSNLPENPRPSAIDSIRAAWLTNPVKELTRLRKIPRVARSLKIFSEKPNEFLVAYGRTLEIQEKLKDTHFVVNTGISGDIALLNALVTAIKKVVEKRVQPDFMHLRHQQFFPKEEREPSFYQKHIRATAAQEGKSDHDYSADLISADLFLESIMEGESALSFFTGHPQIQAALHPGFVSSLIKRVTHYYFGNEVAKKLERKLSKVVSGSTLYSICIPKEKLEDIAYVSRPFGIAYRKGFFTDREICGIQSGTNQNFAENPPQVRVLAHKLDPNEDVYVVPSSTTSIDIQRIERIIQRAVHGF